MRAPFQEGEFPGPVKYGYISVGVVREGPRELVDRLVFCLYPHQDWYQVPVEALTVLPKGLPASRAVLAAGMETALNALWDAEVKLGDRVTVIGAGVIGSLVAYLANQIPGTEVELVDINEERAKLASSLGLRFATPDCCSNDVDLVVHASGSEAGLSRALSIAGQESRVVELSWYGDREVRVALGHAFHPRRLRLQSSQVGRIPTSQAARWDYRRRLGCALGMLGDSRLDTLISDESDFDDLPARMGEILAPGGSALCHRVRYRKHKGD